MAHSSNSSVGKGSFPDVERPQLGVKNEPLLSAECRMSWSLTSAFTGMLFFDLHIYHNICVALCSKTTLKFFKTTKVIKYTK